MTPQPSQPGQVLPWDPYPGTIPASMKCKTCGFGPLWHIRRPPACDEFLATWPPIEGIIDPWDGD